MGQNLWKDIYEHSLEKVVTVQYVNGHQPLHSPGNVEADDLACMCWLEEAPAEDTVKWFHRKMCHAGQKILGEVVKTWRRPLQCSHSLSVMHCLKHPHWLPKIWPEMGGHHADLLVGQLNWPPTTIRKLTLCPNVRRHDHWLATSIPMQVGHTVSHHLRPKTVMCCPWDPRHQ